MDPRFTLHIRGRMPWEYPYVWQKAGEREAYLAFFEEFGGSSLLADHVALEPFGADMGSWLRKVGFVLSPSTSESFHLAPVEGMASGSISHRLGTRWRTRDLPGPFHRSRQRCGGPAHSQIHQPSSAPCCRS